MKHLLLYLCLCELGSIVAIAQTEQNLSRLLDNLARPEQTRQAAAVLRKQALARPSLRSQLGKLLPNLLSSATDVDVTQSEATLAGKLQLVSVVPVLIRLLDDPLNRGANCVGPREGCAEMGTMTTLLDMGDDPIARALGDIGAPAVPSLSVPLDSAHLVPRKRAARILIFIGTTESFAVLQRHVDRETDTDLKRYIAANLDRFRELNSAASR